jgi:signal transduction histidine kinase
VDPVVEMTEAAVERNRMRIERRVIGAPIRVSCDADLMKIVLTNLIGNAAKYGREGGKIRLTVERRDDTLAVSVWNEGQGFRAGDRSALFRKFSRLSVPDYRQVTGSGVGLYTAWRIVNLHQGRISAQSRFGQWAEFRFELPLKSPGRGVFPEVLGAARKSR